MKLSPEFMAMVDQMNKTYQELLRRQSFCVQ